MALGFKVQGLRVCRCRGPGLGLGFRVKGMGCGVIQDPLEKSMLIFEGP